jgi:hypothetical protein
LERSLDAGERVRRGIGGIFLTLSVRTTILDKGFRAVYGRLRSFCCDPGISPVSVRALFGSL